MTKKYTEKEIDDIMDGYEESWDKYVKDLRDSAPKCHFTPMDFVEGENYEAWWECYHCGHTKEA